MANTHSPLAPVNFIPQVQDFRNMRLVAKAISDTKFSSKLYSGQSIDFPYISGVYTQDYTPGTDLTIANNTATSDTMTINQSKASTFTLDPNQQAQAEDKTIQARLADQQAFVLASTVDQTLFTTMASGAVNTTTVGTVNVSNIISTMSSQKATLARKNANRSTYAVLDPERIALLEQAQIANGFSLADSALRNGYVGDTLGFKVFSSNNLPTSVGYTMDTINTAGKVFEVAGVEFTFVANGTAANAGEISIGANVTANQANFLLAINGTGTPGASTYIDVSAEDRITLKNAGIAASAFATNVSTITGFGKLDASTDSADGNNDLGAETGSIFFGEMGSTGLGMQIMPSMYEGREAKRPETNYILHELFGTKVFYRAAKRIINATINV